MKQVEVSFIKESYYTVKLELPDDYDEDTALDDAIESPNCWLEDITFALVDMVELYT